MCENESFCLCSDTLWLKWVKWFTQGFQWWLYQTSSRGGGYKLTRFGGPEPGLFEALYQNRSSCKVILKESKIAEWLEWALYDLKIVVWTPQICSIVVWTPPMCCIHLSKTLYFQMLHSTQVNWGAVRQ